MIAALLVIPQLIHAMDATRFGLLSLVWMIVGYFSLFDLGLGRALTQVVAARRDSRDEVACRLVWTALAAAAAVGIFGGSLFALAIPVGVGRFLAVTPNLRSETSDALLLAAAAIPLVVVTSGLRGLLEGHGRFDVANALRAPLGVLTLVAPLLSLQLTQQLPGLVAALVVVRLLGCIAHIMACSVLLPELRKPRMGSYVELRQLLSFGGWLTVSNIVAPLLMYSARIALAMMVSGASVAYFSTPSDIVINFLVLPSLVANVLYPRFSALIGSDKHEAMRLYKRAILLIGITSLPVCILAAVFCHPAIAWWISPEFADQSAAACRLLIAGVFVNGFAFLFEAVIQGAGRPDVTAKLHLFELALYLPYMVVLIDRYGVIGAAIAWIIRIVISTVGLAILSHRCLLQETQPRPATLRESDR